MSQKYAHSVPFIMLLIMLLDVYFWGKISSNKTRVNIFHSLILIFFNFNLHYLFFFFCRSSAGSTLSSFLISSLYHLSSCPSPLRAVFAKGQDPVSIDCVEDQVTSWVTFDPTVHSGSWPQCAAVVRVGIPPLYRSEHH